MSQSVLINLEGKDLKNVASKLHKQFGHPTALKLIDLIEKAGVSNNDLKLEIKKISDNCEICAKFKKPTPRPVVSMPMASHFNDTISMDLKIWHNKYFLVMIDNATRFCTATVINNKLPSTIISGIFSHWIVLFGAPKRILTDNGGEFNNEELRALGESYNIRVMATAAESPWSNGVCERLNAVIGDSVRKIIADSKCSVEIALAWAVSARNSLSNNSGFSPNQLVFGRNPCYPNVFSDMPPALNPSPSSDLVRQNLNAMHTAREAFVKYESSEKLRRALRHNIRSNESSEIEIGDHVYYKRNNSHEWHGPGTVIGREGKQFLVRHGGIYVRVHECRLVSTQLDKVSKLENESVQNDESNSQNLDEDSDFQVDNASPIENEVNDPQMSEDSDYSDASELPEPNPSSVSTSTSYKIGQRIKGFLQDSGEQMSGRIVSRAGKATGKHKNCFNIKKDCDGSIHWLDLDKHLTECEIVPDDLEMMILFNSDEVICAKNKEIENWRQNNVYDEVENMGQEYVSVRWVVTEKIKEGKEIIKARLVARGFEENTSELSKYSPTCSKESIRLAISIASSNGWSCQTIDVKSAYLQGNAIAREIYLKPPPECDQGKLWKLNKTVYGLSDAARQWYLRVKEELLKLGVTVSRLDPALFAWHEGDVLKGIICLYVDDFLWAGTESFQEKVINQLTNMFMMGSIASKSFKYVGLDIKSDKNSHTTVDQIDYIRSLKPIVICRKRTNEKSSDLSENEKSEYRAVLGQLNWIASHTRPDILYDVCELSVSFSRATVSDLLRLNKVVSRVLCDPIKILFPRISNLEECSLECYSDASFANLPDCGSQGGFIIFLQDSNRMRCPIFWQSRKIKRVVKSTLAAETLAFLDCAETAVYIRNIIQELCKCQHIPINCFVDNKSLLDTLNSKKSVEDRRLRIDLAVLEEMIRNNDITSVSWVSSAHQLANCLTKRGASCQQLRESLSRD